MQRVERLAAGVSGSAPINPLAAATVSALAPVVAASQLGLPLIDADGMGRTYALIHHTAMHLVSVSPTPLVAHGPTGESVLIDVYAGPRASRLLRGNVETLGGWAALAAYPTTAGVLRRAALHGTMSRPDQRRAAAAGAAPTPTWWWDGWPAMTGCRRCRPRTDPSERLWST